MSDVHVNPEYPTELEHVKILDHGFVALVDVMGTDASIVQAARVSYGKGTKTMRTDKALISYLMRHRHTTPLEMVEFKFLVRLPVFIARQMIRHRTACLAEGTEVYFDLPGGIARRGNQLYKLKIEDIWDRFQPTKNQVASHQRNPYFKRDRLLQMRLRQINEDTLRIQHTRVQGVCKNGVKPVFRVILKDGKTIEATADHRFFFENGWQTLKAATGLHKRSGKAVWGKGPHRLYVNGQVAYESPDGDLMVCDGNPHNEREWLHEQYRVLNRKIGDIAIECGVSYHTIRNGYTCQLCHQRSSDLHCHHIVPVWADPTLARDESNLTTLCAKCHRPIQGHELTFVERLGGPPVKTEWNKRPRVAWNKLTVGRLVEIERFEYVGCKETYDIEVEGPYHNFIANGVVTHNSVNEYSARYSEVPDRFFVPALGAISTQDNVNRQGRADLLLQLAEEKADLDEACAFVDGQRAVLKHNGRGISRAALQNADHRAAFSGMALPSQNYVWCAERLLEHFPERRARLEEVQAQFRQTNETAYGLYQNLIGKGIAREIARCVLPLTMYTEWYWKIDLHNLFHFLALRMDAHAQLEVRELAEAMATFVKPVVPFAWDAFQESRIQGAFLSRAEKEVLCPVDEPAQRDVLSGLYERGYRRRRLKEVCRKLSIDERLVDEMWPPPPPKPPPLAPAPPNPEGEAQS